MVPLTIRVPAPLLESFKRIADHEYDTVGNRLRMLMREDVRGYGPLPEKAA